MWYPIAEVRGSGIRRRANLASFIAVPGIITVFLVNIFFTAYRATSEEISPLRANFTLAVLLKLVSTGPGHSAPMYTFDLLCFSSRDID